MFKKLFQKSAKKPDQPEDDREVPDPSAAQPNPENANPKQGADAGANVKARKVDAKAEAASHSKEPSGDGGAGLYKRLQQEADERAKARERGELESTSAPTFSMKLQGTQEALQAVATQSKVVRGTRLMKELSMLQKSAAVKDGVFTVSLVDDNLFEWDVKYYKFDPESLLANDLANMALDHEVDNVWFRFSFPENFPFAPPFVRVLAPLVQGGFVLSGGAICLELLTPQGWVQSCKIEAVILQVAAAITQGNARIVPQVAAHFSEGEARRAYDYLVKTHAKYGWKDPAKEDG